MGFLSKMEARFILDTEKRIPMFYCIPKIHKNLQAPPGHPIVSGIESTSCNLSKYIDQWLQPYVKRVPSYICDTTDIIKTLETIEWVDGWILGTLDVGSLYTVIDHTQGIQALHGQLSGDAGLPSEQLEFLLGGVEYILAHNYFSFEQEFYVQRPGTAMGTRFAPSYANLFLAQWEREVIQPRLEADLVLWRRYISMIGISSLVLMSAKKRLSF